jgi:DNA modification methylase
MTEFGYVEPIVWNKRTGYVVGGHQRLKILEDMGETEIECVVVDLDPKDEKGLNVALNKISGDWDYGLLTELFDELSDLDYDLTLTGFDESEINALLSPVSADDDEFNPDVVIENIEEPVTEKGDVWFIGKHKLMCGDSTTEDVSLLMGDEGAKFVFTDPPWNVNYGATDHPSWKQRTIMNDYMSSEEFADFLDKAFFQMAKNTVPGAMVYVVMSAQEWGNIMPMMAKNEFHWSSTIIWNKDRMVLSRKDYHTKYEPLWYGWREGEGRLVPLADRKQTDVWDIMRPHVSELHPTMKPMELVARAIQNSSCKGDLILDQFGGSGTTLIAAEQTNRVCNMLELDPKYCDVIVNRYINFVGQKDADIYIYKNGKKTHWKETGVYVG